MMSFGVPSFHKLALFIDGLQFTCSQRGGGGGSGGSFLRSLSSC